MNVLGNLAGFLGGFCLAVALTGAAIAQTPAPRRTDAEALAAVDDAQFLKRLEDRVRRYEEGERRRIADEQQRRATEEQARRQAETDRLAQQNAEQKRLADDVERRRAEQLQRDQNDADQRRREAEAEQRRTAELDREREADRLRQAQLAAPASPPAVEPPREQIALAPATQLPLAVPIIPVAPPPAAAAPPALEPAAITPAAIRQAQVELQRLGCYAGPLNGQMSDRTQKALGQSRDLLVKTRAVGPSLDDLLPELKKERQRLCPLPPKTQQAARPPARAEPPEADQPVRRRVAPRPVERAAPAPRPAPPPRVAEPRPAPGPGPAPVRPPRGVGF